jgi:hypothetical protein
LNEERKRLGKGKLTFNPMLSELYENNVQSYLQGESDSIFPNWRELILKAKIIGNVHVKYAYIKRYLTTTVYEKLIFHYCKREYIGFVNDNFSRGGISADVNDKQGVAIVSWIIGE